ncbi:hypothetical protein OHA10_21755 [Kribbella sp. NBC_00662]|uniref:SRPBCC family protein n=1 Tax=Kribbella sp. NBC_00662 TaxID=2975969 RepID=UPI0032450610
MRQYTVVQEYGYPRDEVWTVLTAPAYVAQWTTTGQGGSMYYTWRGDEDSDDVTDVNYLLEETATGTCVTWTHSGFTGIGGLAMSKLLARVRRTMMTDGLPPVLAAYHASRIA